jgi:hypothetical protein
VKNQVSQPAREITQRGFKELRELCNLVTHEYSGNEQEMVDALNELNTT